MHNSKDSEKSAYIITNSSSGGTDSEATATQQSPFYGRPEQQTQRYSQNNAAQSGAQGGTQSGAQGGTQGSATAQQGQTGTTPNGYAAEYAANGYQQTAYPRNAYQQGNYRQGGQIPVSALPKQKGKSDSKTPWIARLHTGPFIALVAGISLLFGLIGGFGGSAIAFMNSRPSSTQMQMGGPGMMGQSGSGSGQSGSGQSGQSGQSGSGSTGSDSGSSSDSEQSDMGSLSGSTGITYLQIQS